MHLTRCQDQKHRTLEDYYTEEEHSTNPVCREIGRVMLALIARLRAIPDERSFFGLTSHLSLCLLAEDTWKSPWRVIISALDSRNYTVEYLMPAAIAPWPRAHVKGEARSEDEAIQMVLTAIERSEGWIKH
jgi:hypothetical protein